MLKQQHFYNSQSKNSLQYDQVTFVKVQLENEVFQLRIKNEKDIYTQANKFCKKHNLDSDGKQKLISFIYCKFFQKK